MERFLGQPVYTIPSGSVAKGTDPHGRIIHDYSFAPDGKNSINSSLVENSVQYVSFRDRVAALSLVSWYVAVDLKSGYRQLPLSPTD